MIAQVHNQNSCDRVTVRKSASNGAETLFFTDLYLLPLMWLYQTIVHDSFISVNLSVHTNTGTGSKLCSTQFLEFLTCFYFTVLID